MAELFGNSDERGFSKIYITLILIGFLGMCVCGLDMAEECRTTNDDLQILGVFGCGTVMKILNEWV